jgi:hypothetical protein
MRSTRPSTGFGTSVFSIRCRVPSPRTMKPCVGLILRCASISRSCSQAALGVKATPAVMISKDLRQNATTPLYYPVATEDAVVAVSALLSLADWLKRKRSHEEEQLCCAALKDQSPPAPTDACRPTPERPDLAHTHPRSAADPPPRPRPAARPAPARRPRRQGGVR